jgi:hypothetical protein
MHGHYVEFIYWSSVECRGLNVEGEGKKSRARVKSRGLKVEGKKSTVKSRGLKVESEKSRVKKSQKKYNIKVG